MKKILYSIIAIALSLCIVLYFTHESILSMVWGNENANASDLDVLRIYNWEEYISEADDEGEYVDVISEFENYCKEVLGRNVKVEYSTFGTNENMYNELNLSKKTIGGETVYSYDLVCPSEYMIMKMMRENMLEPLDKTKLPNYYANASSYIQNLFDSLTVDGVDQPVSSYAASYMWGTMGFVYNPEFVSFEEASHWSLVWNTEHRGKSTIKDSVRDSLVLLSGYVFADELTSLKEKHDNKTISDSEYNLAITEIFNRKDEASINTIGKALTDLKDNIYGYEVDSGKKDMATGKIYINFAWSGDAVYTMDTAEGVYDDIDEDEIVYLEYAVPQEGSNIWFDGWVMPKGANTELAQEFINFISAPEIAVENMSYIGYTSAIAGDEMFENAIDWYGYAGDNFITEGDDVSISTVDNITTYSYEEKADFDECIEEGLFEAYDTTYLTHIDAQGNKTYSVKETLYLFDEESNSFVLDGEEEFEVYAVDLSYFFDELEGYEQAVIMTAELNRQFTAQYPDYDTITRCTVMESFTDNETIMINEMWQTGKVGSISMLSIGIIIGCIAVAIALLLVILKLYKKGILFQPRAPKGYTLTDIKY